MHHSANFTVVAVTPGSFVATWDISLKVPYVVRNGLPVSLHLKTYFVDDYKRKGPENKKEVVYSAQPVLITLGKQESVELFNNKLDKSIKLNLNLDVCQEKSSDQSEFLLNWKDLSLAKEFFKVTTHQFAFKDRTNG